MRLLRIAFCFLYNYLIIGNQQIWELEVIFSDLCDISTARVILVHYMYKMDTYTVVMEYHSSWGTSNFIGLTWKTGGFFSLLYLVIYIVSLFLGDSLVDEFQSCKIQRQDIFVYQLSLFISFFHHPWSVV